MRARSMTEGSEQMVKLCELLQERGFEMWETPWYIYYIDDGPVRYYFQDEDDGDGIEMWWTKRYHRTHLSPLHACEIATAKAVLDVLKADKEVGDGQD